MHLIKTPREIRNNTREIKNNTIEINRKLDGILDVLACRPVDAEASKFRIYGRLDFNLILDSSSLVDKTIIEQGGWEVQQVEFICNMIKRLNQNSECIFLDIGAYWGLYSMAALRAGVPDIIAFEADKNNYAQFRAQQFLNNTIDLIQCHNLAVSDKRGTAVFWDSRKHPDGNRAGVGIVGPSHNDDTYEVETVSIDEYLTLSDKVIIAKLDVEGNEPNVLSGMKKTIQDNQVVLQIEMLPGLEQATIEAVEMHDLRKIGEIHVDHYYTNMSATQIGL